MLCLFSCMIGHCRMVSSNVFDCYDGKMWWYTFAFYTMYTIIRSNLIPLPLEFPLEGIIFCYVVFSSFTIHMPSRTFSFIAFHRYSQTSWAMLATLTLVTRNVNVLFQCTKIVCLSNYGSSTLFQVACACFIVCKSPHDDVSPITVQSMCICACAHKYVMIFQIE